MECAYDGGDCSLSNEVGQLLIDGNVVNVEKYKQNTRTNSITQIISSMISFVSSIGIIWILRRSYKGLFVPFNRLLLGLCVADICSFFAQTFVTLPAPDSLGGVIWNARGNKGSCQAQGFFIFLGSIGTPLYNCSMSVYYFIVLS